MLDNTLRVVVVKEDADHMMVMKEGDEGMEGLG
jgi:hypothetical protein